MASATAFPETQFIVMEDQPVSAQHLTRELRRHGADARTTDSLEDTVQVASRLASGVFAIDIHMGEQRETEGLEVIGALNSIRGSGSEHKFLIVALTSHAELQAEASAKGVDAFLVKTDPPVDALQLISLQADHHAEGVHGELSRLLLSTLVRQLEFAAGTAPTDITHSGIARRTIRRALSGVNSQPTQMVLSAIDEQLRVAEGVDVPKRVELLGACLAGARLLTTGARRDSCVEWLKHMEQLGTPIFGWVVDDESDE